MTLFLIDGHAIAYRSYYAFIRNPLTNSRGENTSAAYGFIRLLMRLIQKHSPENIAVVFDSEEETHRHEKFEDYKAQRKEMPEDMASQMPVILDLIGAMGIPVLAVPGYEADDIIATLAKQAATKGMDVRIVSGDKDLFQLLDDRIRMIRPAKGDDLTGDLGPEYLEERFGLRPDQIVDFLALMGDSSDNIPGVRGIGEKTALQLLHEYGSLDRILSESSSIKPAHVARKIEAGREEALFSRDLVRLVDVPGQLSPDELKIGRRDDRKLTDLLLGLEFHQIIKELSLGSADREESGYVLVDEKGLRRLAGKLRSSGDIVLDVETTSLDPIDAELVGISFSVREGEAWYVPVESGSGGPSGGLFGDEARRAGARIPISMVRRVIGPVLADEKVAKTGHNIKYDLIVLESHGFKIANVRWDTMVASYCLDPSRRSHSLDNLALELCGHTMIPYKDMFDAKDRERDIRKVPLDRISTYSCEDADYTLRLRRLFEKALVETGSKVLFEEIEMPLSFVLKRMEQEGISIDKERLSALSAEISAELVKLTGRIYDAAGEEFNINSNRQLQQILFEKMKLPVARKTKTGYSTDVDVLTELAVEHPIARLLLDYRQLSKLLSTYVDALPQLVKAKTNRIHTSFNQTVTATGRLSSSDPNLQNIPIRTELGRQIRSAFVPGIGGMILDADYSQIELRIMAHLSKDPELLASFREEADIHTRTASRIYGVGEADVTREMRDAAKTINFGVMYGQGPRALSQQLRIPYEEAKRFIDEYFEKYPGIRDFMEESKERARKYGYAETLLGRRRPLPDITSSNGGLRSFAERIAVNMPIQGTAADLIKIAMINIDRAIASKGLSSRMILQVHDELVFDVADGEGDRMEALVKNLMESALDLDVPLKVEVGKGSNWLEAH